MPNRKIHRNPPHWGVVLAAAVAVVTVACAPQSGRQPVFPESSWAYIGSPESVGWSGQGLQQVQEKLETLSSSGFMAVVGGRVLFEYGDVDTVSYLASVRKSILSMLYGIYVDRGEINLDKTLAELGIDDHQSLSDQEKQATIRHIISARSGIYHPASNAGDDLASAPERGSQAPGSYYLYSNWDFNVAGFIFEQETGKNIYDALQEHLVIPLQFQDFNRERHRKSGNLSRSLYPAYHINLSTRDMARVGYLMLREGNWCGEQIVPAEWVRESVSLITPRAEMNPAGRRRGAFGYGYMWWVFDNPDLPDVYRGAYTGLGAVGQQILVMPALDLVVAHKTVPGQGRSVGHGQFLEVIELLIDARLP